MGDRRHLQVVALGARTPVGGSAESAAAAVRAGVSRLGTHPFMVDPLGAPVRMAMDPGLDPEVLGWPRILSLAESAIAEVIDKTGPDRMRSGEIFLALPETRPGFSERDAREIVAQVASGLAATGIPVTIGGRGHAGALQALAVASEKLAAGRIELGVVVGADSYCDADTIEWLAKGQQLVGEDTRNGLVPGEAAGALIVGEASVCRSLQLSALGAIRGLHTTMETKLIKTDADVRGEGLSGAVLGAIAALRLPAEAIDAVYCDINGERYRTDEWAFTVLRLGQALRQSAYEAPSECWGDVGAASGVLGCILAMRSWQRNYAAGPRSLVWASSESGLRAAIVLQQPEG